MYIEWNDDYLIGYDFIDQQHKDLFFLANKIFACTEVGSMIPCFMALFEYVNFHFKEEESIMATLEYHYIQEHMVLHIKMVEALALISESMALGTLDLEKIHRFMANWLLVHIRTEDKKLFDFVKG